MSRQRPDPNEVTHDLGPLFAPRLRQLSHATDPATSVKAAAGVLGYGLGAAQARALALIEEHPGSTTKELAAFGLRFPEDLEQARQRIGRRLSEMLKAGAIHRRGERDGCALWWPGPEVNP